MNLRMRERHRFRSCNTPISRLHDRRNLERKDLNIFIAGCVQVMQAGKLDDEERVVSALMPNKQPLTAWQRRAKQKARRYRRFKVKEKLKIAQQRQEAELLLKSA